MKVQTVSAILIDLIGTIWYAKVLCSTVVYYDHSTTTQIFLVDGEVFRTPMICIIILLILRVPFILGLLLGLRQRTPLLVIAYLIFYIVHLALQDLLLIVPILQSGQEPDDSSDIVDKLKDKIKKTLKLQIISSERKSLFCEMFFVFVINHHLLAVMYWKMIYNKYRTM